VLDYADDWNAFIRDVLGARLDRQQRNAVDMIQHYRRVAIQSGHARGKDYLAACVSLTFLCVYYPSKVINTAPTDRQVKAIMMTEIGKLHANARVNLGGELLAGMIRMPAEDWFLIGFKAADRKHEAWTGFHSPNILVVVTEASGVEDETHNVIEGVLTGSMSRELLIFNPNRSSGEAFRASRDPKYAKMKLSCLNAPNVRAKKILIPGQVDYEWVADKVGKPGWSQEIDAADIDRVAFHDFKFDGRWYRPSDLFLVKVMGEFPRESEEQLIPLSWLEASHDRWSESQANTGNVRLGADIAGMGNDRTVFAPRYENFVDSFLVYSKADHMETAGRIKTAIGSYGTAFIDSIGEGAGVYSRLVELGANAVSAKFSEAANGLRDMTGEREFVNMRAYCYWALRDALDSKLGGVLALPPDDELDQELTSIQWAVQSNGKIKIEPKDDIKKRIARSPDKADAVALTFWPDFSLTNFAFASGQMRE